MGPATAADIKAEKPKSVAIVLPPGAGECIPISISHMRMHIPNTFRFHPKHSKHPEPNAKKGEDALASVAEDMLSGLYLDNRFKTGDGVEKPPQVCVL
jgi:hypothetical protein